MDRLFVEDLEEDGSRGNERVEDSDDDLHAMPEAKSAQLSRRAGISVIKRTIVGNVKAAEHFNHQPVKDPYPGVVANPPA